MAAYTQWIPSTGELGYPALISAFMVQLEEDVTNLQTVQLQKMPKLSSGTAGDLVKINSVLGVETANIVAHDVVTKDASFLITDYIPKISGASSINSSLINVNDVVEKSGSLVEGNSVEVNGSGQVINSSIPASASIIEDTHVSIAGQWGSDFDTGIGTNWFAWGILGIKKSDETAPSLIEARAVDSSGYIQILLGNYTITTKPSIGKIRVNLVHSDGNDSYSVRLWYQKITDLTTI